MLLSSSHRDKTEDALHKQQSTELWYYYATKYDTWRPIAPQQVPQQVRQNVRTIPQYVQYPQYLATMSPIVAPIKTLPSIQSHVIVLDCKRHTLCGNPENRTKKKHYVETLKPHAIILLWKPSNGWIHPHILGNPETQIKQKNLSGSGTSPTSTSYIDIPSWQQKTPESPP